MTDLTLRLDQKDAKKLLNALNKGTFNKLTPKEAEVLSDFICSLLMEVGQ